MDIKKLLQMPDNMAGKDIQTVFKNIAENLFQGFCLQCGKTIFYFAEIEFYYYDKDDFCEEWNKRTYPRTGKDVMPSSRRA